MAESRRFHIPVGEVEVTEYDGLTIFISEHIGTFEANGWEGSIETTGKKLIIRLGKDGEHVVQSVELTALISPWVDAATKAHA